MTSFKLFFLFVVITMMQHHGIIYRTDSRRPSMPSKETMDEMIKPTARNIYGTWRLSGVSSIDQGVVDMNGMIIRQDVVSGKPDMLISFFPDSTFTRVRPNGEYTTGKWAFDDAENTVFLTADRKTEEIGIMISYAANGLRLVNFEFSRNEHLSFIEYGRKLPRYQDDPYFGPNNQWRIKPEQPETDAQIKARLLNYLAHISSVLESAQMREQDYLSLEFSPGIVKLYNVGVGAVPENKIPASWINSFYSDEQARKAYRLFQDYLLEEKLPVRNTGNWVRDDHTILVEIQEGLKKKS